MAPVPCPLGATGFVPAAPGVVVAIEPEVVIDAMPDDIKELVVTGTSRVVGPVAVFVTLPELEKTCAKVESGRRMVRSSTK